MKRRRAIRVMGGVAGASIAITDTTMRELINWGMRVRASIGSGSGHQPPSKSGHPTELTPERALVMEALADIIIPETETPGAAQAGVTEFVSALVDGWLEEDRRDRFLAGLDTVDPIARERFGADFAECARHEQSTLVGEFDSELTRLRDDPAENASGYFFSDVKRFALTAYFTSKAGLEAMGHRTAYRTFEGCAVLTPVEVGAANNHEAQVQGSQGDCP